MILSIIPCFIISKSFIEKVNIQTEAKEIKPNKLKKLFL